MDRIVSIIRENGQLYALAVRLAGTFKVPGIAESQEEVSPGAEYEIVKTPLVQVHESLVPQKKRLLASWEELSCTQEIDHLTLCNILRVLLESRASSSGVSMPLPAFITASQEQAFRPTAAHPRAYKGTKSRPPKFKQPGLHDIRPYIESANNQRMLLSALQAYLDRAIELLRCEGYDRERLAFVESGLGRVEPYLAYHNCITDTEITAMPVLFSSHLLPALKGLDVDTIKTYLSLFHGLNLQERPDLLATLMLLAALEPCEYKGGWARLIGVQKRERQAELACFLIESGITKSSPETFTAADLERFNSMTPEEAYSHRLYYLVAALSRGISKDYLFAGFHLANSFRPLFKFDLTGDCRDFPLQQVEDLVIYLHSEDSENSFLGSYYPMRLWESCGLLRGLALILRQFLWNKCHPDVAGLFLDMLTSVRYDDLDENRLREKWAFICEQAPALFEMVQRIMPPYQEKFIKSVQSLHWHWDGKNTIDSRFDILYDLGARLSQRPFSKDTIIIDALFQLFDYDDGKQQSRICNAPDNSFRQLEKAYKRRNDERPIDNGLLIMKTKAAEFTLLCFLHFPASLFRVAKRLGTLSISQRYQVMGLFNDHVLMTTKWDKVTAGKAAEILQPFTDEGFSNPLPRKLRDWLAGSTKLSDLQYDKYIQMMREKILQTQLEMLEHIARRSLAVSIPVETLAPDIEHALQMINLSDTNLRAFRRFLKAILGGNHDYLITHPLTVEWIARHPELDIGLWSKGLSFHERIPELGPISLSLEQDPLEALKLGTHVGSCLGLGGRFSYSALAVVLDLNKQVIYARDDKGRVLARQLVAIAEDNRLICFHIYPEGAHRRLRKLFREYDRRFAEALGIAVYAKDDKEKYDIVNIISTDWWDDGAWHNDSCDSEQTGNNRAELHYL